MSATFKTYFARNLKKVVDNIMTLFTAFDEDLGEHETAISTLEDKVEDIRSIFEDANVTAIVVDQTIYDNAGHTLLDSGDESVVGKVVYIQRPST